MSLKGKSKESRDKEQNTINLLKSSINSIKSNSKIF